MKILVLFNGGVNSTYSLWRWLSETDHQIEARYINSSFDSGLRSDKEAWRPREQAGCASIVAWLKSNVRDFNFEIYESSVDYVEEMIPLRVGFTNIVDVGHLRVCWEDTGDLLDDIKPDGYVHGFSAENSAMDFFSLRTNHKQHITRDGISLYFGGARELGVPWDVSTPEDGDAWCTKNCDIISAGLSGRFEQFELMPDALVELIPRKHLKFCDPIADNLCRSCLYEKVREKRTDLSGKELDDIYAKHGRWGVWRSEADPETYTYRNNDTVKSLELLGYTHQSPHRTRVAPSE